MSNKIQEELAALDASLWRARVAATHSSSQHTQIGHAIDALNRIKKALADQVPAAWMYDQARYGPTDLRGQQWLPTLSRLKPYTGDGRVRGLTPLYPPPQALEQQQDDPCPGCRKGAVCRTPACGRLKLPENHPYRIGN